VLVGRNPLMSTYVFDALLGIGPPSGRQNVLPSSPVVSVDIDMLGNLKSFEAIVPPRVDQRTDVVGRVTDKADNQRIGVNFLYGLDPEGIGRRLVHKSTVPECGPVAGTYVPLHSGRDIRRLYDL